MQAWLRHTWLEEKISVSANKTKCMDFEVIQKLNTVGGKLGDALLEQVDNYKYLDLNLEACLNSQGHANAVRSKVGQRIGVPYKVRQFITVGTANTLCKALIRLIIDYGSII